MSALKQARINILLSAAVIVCMLAAVCISTRASDRAIRESQRSQCEAWQSDVDAYIEVPPITKAGINQLRSKQELLRRFGCPVPKD